MSKQREEVAMLPLEVEKWIKEWEEIGCTVERWNGDGSVVAGNRVEL